MKCRYCNGVCVKKGKQNDKQRYYCKLCKKYQLANYSKNIISDFKIELVRKLTVEGVGISSISRLVQISKSSVQRIILRLAKFVYKPEFHEKNQSYEIDELRTYVGAKKNECWVIYAINRKNGEIIDMIVGRRTKKNIKTVVETVLSLNPKKIFTDRLITYRGLIPKKIHSVFPYKTNKIERRNLTLRTHLKRLSRKTICYSKSISSLDACLRIYTWGNSY